MAIINGTPNDDTLKGTASNDIISGGNGNDTIGGGDGHDIINGGDGHDTIGGGDGNDIINGGDGNDTINGGDDNDMVFGDAGNDTLKGGAGNDIVDGGIGDDTLDGGAEADLLTGGSGSDKFIYKKTNDSPYSPGDPNAPNRTWDIITDFQSSQGDTIDFSQIILTGPGPSQLTFTNTTTTDVAAGMNDATRAHTVWTSIGGAFLYADINGDGAADMKIQVSGVVADVNDAPVLDPTKTPAGAAVLEDAGAPVGAVGTLVSALVDFPGGGGHDNVTDVDTGAVTGIAITAADAANGSWFYSTNGGMTWSALGTPTAASARLLAADADNRLYFQPTANYDGAPAITFRAPRPVSMAGPPTRRSTAGPRRSRRRPTRRPSTCCR
jgi:hypothetical protein